MSWTPRARPACGARHLRSLAQGSAAAPVVRAVSGCRPWIESPADQVVQRAAGELACRPGSVYPLARAGGHPSGTAVAGSLVRSTREHRAGRPRSLAQARRVAPRPSDLAPGGVYQAAAVTCGAGGLLHHRFTLAARPKPDGGLFSVALSRGSPRVGVTDHPALRSPDLPRRPGNAGAAAAARPTRPPLRTSLGPAGLTSRAHSAPAPAGLSASRIAVAPSAADNAVTSTVRSAVAASHARAVA